MSDSSDDSGWDGSIGSSSPSSQESSYEGAKAEAEAAAPTTAMGDVGGPAPSDDSAAEDSGWDGSIGSSSPSSREPQDDGGASPSPSTDSAPTTAMGDVGGPSSDTTTPAADPADDDGWDGSIGSSSPSSRESDSDAPAAKAESAAPAEDTSTPTTTTMGDVAAPPSHAGPVGEDATDTAPATTDAAPADETPATTPMGDYAGPSTPAVDASDFTIGPSSPSSQETTSTTTTSPVDDGPAYTPMGDVGMPGPEASLAPHVDDPELDAPYDPPMQQYGPAYDPSDPVSDEAPAYTPMGDLALPGTETHTPAPTTEEESTGLIQTVEPTGYEAKVTGAFGPLGGTVAFARDDEHTAITFGPAEGFGLFGSFGEARAPAETSMQMSGRLGLGVASGEVTAGSAGITGKVSGNVGSLNQGINQQVTQSLSLNRDGLQTMQTEGVSAGWVSSAGAVVTQTVTISVSNDTLDMIGGMIGLGPEARPADSTGGGGAW